MAVDKQMNMLLTIGAIFQGERAFASIRKSAGSTANAIKKIAFETAGILVGFKAIQGISDFFGGAIREAKDARAAEEKLGVALARNPKIAAKGADQIALRQRELIGLADEMEKTNLLAATSMKEAFSGLVSAGFSPEQITKVSKGVEGLGIALKGVSATKQDMADVSASIQMMVKRGKPGELGKFFSKEDLARFSKLKSEAARGAFAMEWLAKQAGRVDAAMETSAGKAAKAAQNWARLQEVIGKPFIDTQLAFSEMWGEVALAMEPITQEIANAMTPAFKDLANWVRSDLTPAIKEFSPTFKLAFDWIRENWEPISKGLAAIGAGAATLGVFAVISNPITLTIAALTGLAAVIVTVIENWHLIGPAIDSASAAIAKSTEWLWKPMADELTKIWPDIEKELSRIKHLIGGFFTGELDWTALWTGLGKASGKIGEAIGKIDFAGIVTSIGTGIAKAAKSIDWSGIISAIGAGISSAAGTVGGALASVDWKGVATAIGSGIGDAMKTIAWVAIIGPQIIAQGIGDAIVGTDWADVGTKTIQMLGEAIKAAVGAAAFIDEIVVSLVNGIIASLAKSWSDLANEFVRGFQAGLSAVLAEVGSWGPKIAKAIMDGIGTLIPKFELPFGLGGGGNKATAQQLGGVVSHPTLSTLAEKGPEVVIPINKSQRSQGLLAQTAQMMGMGGKGGGGQNISVSMPITVTGAQAGQEASIAREIERHMQDPIKSLLEQLKEARDEERRLAYV